jgi:hypothetical protein
MTDGRAPGASTGDETMGAPASNVQIGAPRAASSA